MARTILVAALLVGIGILVGAYAAPRRSPDGTTDAQSLPVAERDGNVAFSGDGAAMRFDRRDMSAQQLERRLRMLTEEVAAETAERQRLQEQVDTLSAQLAALHGDGADGTAPPRGSTPADHQPGIAVASVSPPSRPGDAPVQQAAAPPPTAGAARGADAGASDTTSPVERALQTAGVDAGTASDIKHRQDALALEEVYLRDQATREQWMGSQRFNDEMAKINSQRLSMRDEIGDDAYDRFLAAQGQPNRVQVNDVLTDSPAAQAGLQVGDQVVRYGDARIFAPGELVQQTHSGTVGDNVQVEVVRNGTLMSFSVPRGPLGITISPAAGQALSSP